MCSNFTFLDQLLFELLCKNTHTDTHIHTHTGFDEYSIVSFCKNATIMIYLNEEDSNLCGFQVNLLKRLLRNYINF